MSIQNIKLYSRHSEDEKIRLVTPVTLIDAQKLHKLRVDALHWKTLFHIILALWILTFYLICGRKEVVELKEGSKK